MKVYVVSENEFLTLSLKLYEKILNKLKEWENFNCTQDILHKVQIANDFPGKTCAKVTIHGIPNSGVPVAYNIVSLLNDNPEFRLKYYAAVSFKPTSNFIVDIIRDSGKTKEQYSKIIHDPDCFFALIDKKESGLTDYWIKFPWETLKLGDISETSPENIPLQFLEYIGENTKREGLLGTPSRVIDLWNYQYSGYNVDIEGLFINSSESNIDKMIVLDNLEYYSTCECHLLPIFGKCYIGYIPNKKIIEVSKLIQLVDAFSQRLQMQENLTQQIAGAIMKYLEPMGVGVIMTGNSMCMRMVSQGIQKQEPTLKTFAVLGAFKEFVGARNEFLNLIAL